MMGRKAQLAFLKADRGAVLSALNELSEDEAIDRLSLEGRLEEIDDELRSLSQEPERASVSLKFGGAPVIGSQGIDPLFATSATDAYRKSVMAQAGADATGRLMISDVVRGSFGFQLSEPAPSVPQMELVETETPLARAAHKVNQALELANRADTAHLAGSFLELEPESLASLKSFLGALQTHQASVVIDDEHAFVELRDPQRVGTILEALERIEVTETPLDLTGVLFVLPSRGRFELHAQGKVLTGTTAVEVTPDLIGKLCKVHIVQKRFQHPNQVRTTYTLQSVAVAVANE